MRCRICGGLLENRITDLPFKLGDTSIVIVKALPVLECLQCHEAELEQAVMERVEKLLDSVDRAAELAVLSYAA